MLESEMVIFPIHIRDHWILVVADPSDRTINLYDSLKFFARDRHLILDAIGNLSKFIWGSTSNNDTTPWTQNIIDDPQQRNGVDCGVFCLAFANYGNW